jgi:beta-lactamase regulating signal transducer with metallopeptidase domain
METIFKLVLTTSLYASIVGVAILILKTILKNKINPKWHYIIWVVLMLKLLIPFGPESAVSLFNTVPQIPQQTNFTQAYEEYHQSITLIRQEKTHIPTSWTIRDYSLYLAAKAETAIPHIWFLGAMLMLGWLLYTNYSLRRKLIKTTSSVPESINRIFEECKIKTGITKNVGIVLQDAINTPAIFGLFRPKILLSPNILDFSDKEISYILIHELTHYKRKDILANYLLLLFQVIHWFNPIIWYCFKKVRQDMEIATDEHVVNLLSRGEEKEYGKALLSVLESFKAPSLAPKLIGMVDDKKNIERRIKMIKMKEFFKNRRRIVLTLGVLCVAIMSGILLTSGLTKHDSTTDTEKYRAQDKEYDAATLQRFKTPYVGNNGKVVNLISSLPYANFRRTVSLETKEVPYGINVDYDFESENTDIEQMKSTFWNNAAVLFALIDNVDSIDFNVKVGNSEEYYQYTREQLQKSFNMDLREYSKDAKELDMLLNSFSLKLLAYPQKYTLTMSSTPGIRISPQYTETADKVRYVATTGRLLTWNGGKIIEYGKSIELPLDTPIYWSPLVDGEVKDPETISVKVTILNKKVILTEKQVNIKYDPSTYFYNVEASKAME